MRQYNQLTEIDRTEIFGMKQAGSSNASIARHLGVHRSTIGRELKRNLGQHGYRPMVAQRLAQQRRRQAAKSTKMTPQLWDYIAQKLQQEHSPEQIAGRMKRDPDCRGPYISHECIYQHLWKDKANGGELYQYLRLANRKKRRKRYGKHDSRGRIPNRVGIEERPAIVENKQRLGDWEADTILGKGQHGGAIISLVERKTQFSILAKVPEKTAAAVHQRIVKELRPFRQRVHTITVDNGREFTQHQQIAQKLQTQIYFADPYHAWQRGLNEQVNGLVRQYIPGKTDLSKITDEHLRFIMDRLNHRPRKLLGFRTPYEVFYKKSHVALKS